MGRRKIEIQPITHERNRSVTFLKAWRTVLFLSSSSSSTTPPCTKQRKNGLFKKAYELGVLCSVDVAVIIFEERPGHHVKLYQYGSSDIHDIVQKHLRHDGEKDTRGPPDFSGNANNKLDDLNGDDDDDVDDDDEMPSRSKRRHDGKLKPGPDLVTGNMDYGGHRNVSVPQPPLSLHLSGQSGGGGASIPISNDRGMPRDLSRRNKLTLGHSRSPSDNPNDPNSGPYAYHGSGGGGPFGGRSSGQYQHHTHHSQHHHSGGSGPYQPFFPVSSHTSPPPSFIPLQADFPRGSVPSRGGGGTGGAFGMPPRSNSSNSYDAPGIYNSSMMRSQPPGGAPPSGPGAGGGGNPDLFAAFLDADEQSRHQSQAQQGPGFVGLDWPVHGSGGGASTAPSGPSSSVSNPSGTSSAGPEPPNSNPNWLDFLSGNNPNAPGAPPPSANRDSSMSWERGGGPGGDPHRGGDLTDMFGAGDRGRAGSGGMGGGMKRKVDDDGAGGSILASPASVNGRDGKKDGMKDGG